LLQLGALGIYNPLALFNFMVKLLSCF